ncbi:MAG: hypothetical protein KDG44_07280, partial [Burkholderiaceae bacterium]|nr:hypothetical protein [Burkholderiaceae bacterium]
MVLGDGQACRTGLARHVDEIAQTAHSTRRCSADFRSYHSERHAAQKTKGLTEAKPLFLMNKIGAGKRSRTPDL